jgi:small subunit ribosomal protein S1
MGLKLYLGIYYINMTTKTTKPKVSEMDKLLSSNDAPSLPKSSDMIDGKIVYVGRNEVLVDLDGVLTGLIRGNEAYDESGEYNNLKVGDQISATVIESENEKGLVELSIRRAGHKKAWDKLMNIKKDRDIVEVTVMDANKGGLMVKLNQILGFLPVSQLSPEHYPRVIGGNKTKILEKLKQLTDKVLRVQIIDVVDEEGILIVSEKETEKEERRKVLDKYKKGDVVDGVITGVVDFGAFMEFGEGLEGLIHISEIGWQRIDNPKDIVKEGDKVKAQIIDINTNKVSLSLKRLSKDPWEAIGDKFKVGDKVKGTVIKPHKFGAFVEIESDIQGLARIVKKEEGGDDKNLEIGKEYNFTITNFEPLDHKLGLDLA